MVNIVFHPEAVEDYMDAFDWSFHRNRSIAEKFGREVERAVEMIQQHPLSWSKFDETHRKFLLHRFPYSIIYRLVTDKKIWITAVAHQKREEGYWLSRE